MPELEEAWVYHSQWDGSIAVCPGCGRVGELETFNPDDGILGECSFRCQCGHEFKLGGLYKKVKVSLYKKVKVR